MLLWEWWGQGAGRNVGGRWDDRMLLVKCSYDAPMTRFSADIDEFWVLNFEFLITVTVFL
jgi:hypothetical protein